jgi:hypothetical protein
MGERGIKRNLGFLETDKQLLEYIISGRVATDDIGFVDSTHTIATSMASVIRETARYVQNAYNRDDLSEEQYEYYISTLEHYSKFIQPYL